MNAYVRVCACASVVTLIIMDVDDDVDDSVDVVLFSRLFWVFFQAKVLLIMC